MKKRQAEKLLNNQVSFLNKKRNILAKINNKILRIIFACDIQLGADIHESVQLVHNGLGVTIHPKAKVGKNCMIYQNVTLGGNGKIDENGDVYNTGGPTLEDDVKVYAGACVLGPVTVGKGSIIGANAVVITDVPENSIAVGVPARIKSKKEVKL